MPSDRHTAKYLPFRCSADKAREITDYANSRHLLVSEALRELIDAGLKAKGAVADEDQLYDTVKTAVDEVLKPGIERLAAISAKATQLDAASFFMSLYAMTKDGSPEEQERIQQLSQKIEQISTRKRKTKESASEWLDRINGVSKESFASRSYHEARGVFEAIGQADRYQRTLLTSFLCGVGGLIAGLLLQNMLLSVVLSVGFYFLPLWLTRFSLYRYQRFVNEELETALSLVTTSYLRSSDLLSAIEENLPAVNDPVRSVFVSFVNGLKYVDANAPAQIRRMKSMLDNPLFSEWCDALILCQDNHLLQAALKPIVAKFSVLKAQQEANETRI